LLQRIQHSCGGGRHLKDCVSAVCQGVLSQCFLWVCCQGGDCELMMETSGHGAMRSNRYTSAVARVGLSAMQLPFDALLCSALLERCNQGSCLAVHAPPVAHVDHAMSAAWKQNQLVRGRLPVLCMSHDVVCRLHRPAGTLMTAATWHCKRLLRWCRERCSLKVCLSLQTHQQLPPCAS
jgi:hypothetical protein